MIVLKYKFKAIIILTAIFLVSCGIITPQANIRNHTIEEIDVSEDRIIYKGHMHSKIIMVTDYLTRIENDAMYIKIMHKTPLSSKGARTWFFEREAPMSDNIEKIFFEDNKRQIMVWEKSQGYDKFEIEDMWKDELKKLK